MSKTKRQILNLILLLMLSCAQLAGCGDSTEVKLVAIPRTQYQKSEYKTTTVGRGDINPVLMLTLKPMEIEELKYSVSEPDLEVEDVYVEVGDKVTTGQVLISFKSDEIRKNIDKYRSEVTRSELLLSHYERTYNIDRKDRDDKYGVILQELKDNVEVNKLYLKEEQERLNNCQIVAERDGVVTFISKSVLSGVVDPESVLLMENCGKNNFYAETTDNYDFKIGDVYQADYEGEYCDMTVVDIQKGAGKLRTIIFEPEYVLVNISSVSGINMGVDMGRLSGIVYVDTKAICEKNKEYFVYKVTDDGFLEPVYVTLGDEIDNVTVINSGLEGGEEVALK